MMKPLFSLLSPAGAGARLNVLIFHRVVAEPDALFPGEMHAAHFDTVCTWLRDWFQVLPLDQAVQQWQEQRLPARAAAISFDDGYADNAEVALPILQRHGLPACFFIATGFLDGGCMFNDRVIDAVRHCRQETLQVPGLDLPALPLHDAAARRAAIQRLLLAIKYLPLAERDAWVARIREAAGAAEEPMPMMRSEQVQALHRAGMQIGAHTVQHPILARLSRADARDEIVRGRQRLEDLLQAPVPLFAYPNGKPGEDFSDESVDLVREAGFTAAFTTTAGAAAKGSDPYRLPRFTPWDNTRTRFGLRLADNLLRGAR